MLDEKQAVTKKELYAIVWGLVMLINFGVMMAVVESIVAFVVTSILYGLFEGAILYKIYRKRGTKYDRTSNVYNRTHIPGGICGARICGYDYGTYGNDTYVPRTD